jgi:hypothetical protein
MICRDHRRLALPCLDAGEVEMPSAVCGGGTGCGGSPGTCPTVALHGNPDER